MTAPGWEVQRYRPPGVTVLEIWNRPLHGNELWESLGATRVEFERGHGTPEEVTSFMLRSSLSDALREMVKEYGADAVYVTGGLVAMKGFARVCEGMEKEVRCPVHLAREPRFASVLAGLRLLEDLRPGLPFSVDVGQTSIKCASPMQLHVFERDTAAVPRLFIGMPRPEDRRHVTAAIRFIAGAMHTMGRLLPRAPDAICLGLPCPLDDALVPGGCTYGWEGHATLVADILRTASLPGKGGTVRVLNDAEMAAESARSNAAIQGRRVLCLTLGFGPGGALLER